MNTILLMAIILILIVVATVITKKVPFNFVLLIVPIVCALILGHSVEETSTFVVEQLSSMMQSAGFMLLFAFLYFQMLTEAGVFDTIVTAVTTKLGHKMNVIVIMILTTLIGGFSILTGNFTPAYLITFPILVPLYKRFDFDREAAFIIAQTAMSALCFIPWGIGMAYTASSAGLDANELAAASMPWGLCFIPAIILQWIYFGLQHKKRVGTFQAVAEVETAEEKKEENPNLRPKLFWVNLIIFVIALVALGVFGIAPYFVFIVATVVTAMLNYPKNFGEIFAKVGPMYLNILIMLIAINVYQAVFNNTGMVGAISDALMQFCPEFLLRYIHIILLLLCVVIIYVIPFQIFNALYPIFISIGAGFGIPAVAVIAPFVCNLSLATSSTPTNSSTYTGCALTETEVQHFCKKAVPIQTVTNAVVVLTAVIFGVLQL
ncbi:citrate:H+ symporter [Faecalicatena contorta]|uniref:Citrate:H+ symporter n=1 Tax=Faecalicatena fissicatena TaxID=290055 RepID=A0ABS2E5Q1_9FIRM|nr:MULTISPECIES: SLC13 family permease [Clostridia]MBM6684597.1 citrate:H+ symporter [Faecalicatena contorta]MBM6709859.1 citrate:H+ symporter [Faecalicatena contorta]MBM6736938.1 citrate:H+ symporter [Faecalicatena fissicatena]HIX99287.1 citrate:H+ symporter [Candidatus Dorea intestinigallinarum]